MEEEGPVVIQNSFEGKESSQTVRQVLSVKPHKF